MIRSRLLVLAALTGLSAPLALAAPASATRPHFETIHDDFSNTVANFCDVHGLTVLIEGTFDSRLKSHHRGGQYDFLEHIRVSNVITGADPASQVTTRTAFIQKDLKIADNGDGTITIIALLTGPSTAYGPNGRRRSGSSTWCGLSDRGVDLTATVRFRSRRPREVRPRQHAQVPLRRGVVIRRTCYAYPIQPVRLDHERVNLWPGAAPGTHGGRGAAAVPPRRPGLDRGPRRLGVPRPVLPSDTETARRVRVAGRRAARPRHHRQRQRHLVHGAWARPDRRRFRPAPSDPVG